VKASFRSLSGLTGPLAFATLLLPRLAAACPMCASQQPGGTARIFALGVMILFPFSIAFFVFRALRRVGGQETEDATGRAPSQEQLDGSRQGAH